MNDQLVEEDIQWLAQILARIPGLPVPAGTISKLQANGLISEIPGGWEATDKGIVAIMNWK